MALDTELRISNANKRYLNRFFLGKEFELDCGNYLYEDAIASGGFAFVLLTSRSEPGPGPDRAAIKIPYFTKFDNKDRDLCYDSFFEESDLLYLLDHPHIVKKIGEGCLDGIPYFGLPFFDKTLSDLNGTVENSLRAVIQVGHGLCYLQENDLLHRDVKVDNILGDHDNNAILCDFGTCSTLDDGFVAHDEKSGFCVYGSLEASPPEIFVMPGLIDTAKEWKKRDVFGLGTVLYEMLTHKQPFFVPDVVFFSSWKDYKDQLASVYNLGTLHTYMTTKNICPSLIEVVKKSMAPVDERYESVKCFVSDLEKELYKLEHKSVKELQCSNV